MPGFDQVNQHCLTTGTFCYDAGDGTYTLHQSIKIDGTQKYALQQRLVRFFPGGPFCNLIIFLIWGLLGRFYLYGIIR